MDVVLHLKEPSSGSAAVAVHVRKFALRVYIALVGSLAIPTRPPPHRPNSITHLIIGTAVGLGRSVIALSDRSGRTHARHAAAVLAANYLAIVYSISVWPSFIPAFGSATFTVRMIPCIPENFPVPPVM